MIHRLLGLSLLVSLLGVITGCDNSGGSAPPAAAAPSTGPAPAPAPAPLGPGGRAKKKPSASPTTATPE
jgi:hypothetical protein